MFTAIIYGYDEQVLRTKKFRSFDKLTDYGADAIVNDEDALLMEVEKDGKCVARLDFDEQRDKAFLQGYILPVHKKRLAKGDEDDRRFLAEIEAGRRHF